MPAFLQPIIIPTTAPVVAVPDPGTGSSGAAPTQLIYPLNNVASYTARHGLSRIPQVQILTPTGEEVDTDVYQSPGQTLLVFPKPFTGTLYLE